MKLLSWMRTVKRSGSDTSKEFKGNFCCLRSQASKEVQEVRTNSFSFTNLSLDPKPPRVEEELRFDEDGFCGFLAVGTLGTDPETPKFAASAADAEKGDIRKLIAEKLDKFLEENPESERVERSNAEAYRDPILGGYYDLCQSSDHKLTNGGEGRQKGLLTSLLKRRQTLVGSSMEKHGMKYLIRRIFEKSHGTGFYDSDSMSKKKDIRKSVQILRRKVHPVLSTPTRDDNKAADERILTFTEECLGSSSIAKRETWITSDEEYHVLEL